MNKRKKKLLILAALLCVFPAWAVFNEKDLSQTLSVLRFELSQEYAKRSASQDRIRSRVNAQHANMVEMIKKCNELSLMLYSQNQDCTLDMTYALGEVTREYEQFNAHKMPYDEIVTRFNVEIDRYARLIESLRRLPPELSDIQELPDTLAWHGDSAYVARTHHFDADELFDDIHMKALDSLAAQVAEEQKAAFYLDERGKADRDSCLFYSLALLNMYVDSKEQVQHDSEHYEETNLRLKESYDYAQTRYRILQKRMFTQSQGGYFRTLFRLPTQARLAWQDAKEKYTQTYSYGEERFYSEWRGPIVSGFLIFVLLFIGIASMLTSLLMMILRRRIPKMQTEASRLRTPCIALLCGMFLFGVTIWITTNVMDNNFFRVSSGLLLLFTWLAGTIYLSLLVRISADRIQSVMKLYSPVIILALVTITMRIIFIPNRVMNLLVPPLFLGFFIWQLCTSHRNLAKAELSDKILCGITVFIFACATVMSWVGYIFLSMQVVMWWFFQLGGISTVTALYRLLSMYESRRISQRLGRDYTEMIRSGERSGKNIRITWAHDLFDIALFPILAILTIPMALRLALSVFDLTGLYGTIINHSFFNLVNKSGTEILKFTMHNILLILCLYFAFKFLNYLVRSLYTNYRLELVKAKNGNYEINANQINFTLSNNVIAILVWGTYVAVCILLLNIPVGALSLVATGLAAGLGLAMKDVLNNFIYGIQLMSGRLQVGDWIECDGIRGKVTAISYQSTQIETVDGAIMSFLNAALFNKNFKNLTRNNPYEFVKIPVGVAYGTDVEAARQVILEAVRGIKLYDVYGRPAADPKRDISVVVEGLGDSSVDLSVKLFVLVSQKVAYTAKANEVIYDALNRSGIQIPFPQRDVHIIQDADDKA